MLIYWHSPNGKAQVSRTSLYPFILMDSDLFTCAHGRTWGAEWLSELEWTLNFSFRKHFLSSLKNHSSTGKKDLVVVGEPQETWKMNLSSPAILLDPLFLTLLSLPPSQPPNRSTSSLPNVLVYPLSLFLACDLDFKKEKAFHLP